MSSIFDTFDNNAITPINLIEDGWRQSRRQELVFLKWFTITFKNGRILHCEFLYIFKSQQIVSTETGMIGVTNEMKPMWCFIDNQLKYIREKYEK